MSTAQFLDRQNAITDERYRYFGVEIELWRIGDSRAAPKFNIVSIPNNWSRAVSQSVQRAGSEELSGPPLLRQRFWTAFGEHVNQTNRQINAPNPVSVGFVFFPIGRAGFRLKALMSTLGNRLVVRLDMFGPNTSAHFNLLMVNQAEIEDEISELCEDVQLEWIEESNAVVLNRHNIDPTDEADWPNQHAWLAEKLELFDRVFRPRIQNLNANDWQPEEENEE